MAHFLGSNPYKFGLFGANCAGGMTLSAAPERWRADWDEIVELYRLADDAGIEFILPIAKWRGLGGDADMWGRSYETFTHSAAAGALTKRIGVFSTAHVPSRLPAFAAKAIATIDHVTHGRAALNIVCGWNRDEFDIHGATIDGELRYEQGLEWFRIYAKILEGGPPFDWTGEFYKLRGVTDPLPLQRPRPPIMSAGFSPQGATSPRRPRTSYSPTFRISKSARRPCEAFTTTRRSTGARSRFTAPPTLSAARRARKRKISTPTSRRTRRTRKPSISGGRS